MDLHLALIAPQLTLASGGCLVLCEGLLFRRPRHGLLLLTTLAAATASLGLSVQLLGVRSQAFAGAVVVDPTVAPLLALLALCAFLGAAVSPAYLNRYRLPPADYYTLLLFAACGMQFLVAAGDLITLFVALETLSVCLYALTGYRSRQDASTEGALKYFLLGAFATGFLLFGMAFLYGAAGTTSLQQIGTTLLGGELSGQSALFARLGLGLLLVGMAFKVGAVPFHMWVPDAYQGAPTPVTAFMSVAVKTAAFGILLRTLLTALGGLSAQWAAILGALSLATMAGGNLLALVQNNVKRMLAYSSVAHAGYLLLGVVAASRVPAEAAEAVVFYLFVYAFMNLGAFAALIAAGGEHYERTRLADLEGLSEGHPVLSALFALFLLALAGMPPTGGFLAKFRLFSAAIHGGFTFLAIAGILASVVGVVYYLRVIVALYMKPAREGLPPAAPRGLALTFVLALCALGTIGLGLRIGTAFTSP